MKNNRRIILSFVWLFLGFILFGLGLAGKVDDFWSGMGGGYIAVGVLQLVRFYRFRHDEAYREQVETAMADERNHFLRNKAWAWAGYLFILLAGVSVIGFKLMGQDLLSMAASVAVCLMLILYWVSYLLLKRKY